LEINCTDNNSTTPSLFVAQTPSTYSYGTLQWRPGLGNLQYGPWLISLLSLDDCVVTVWWCLVW